MPNGCEAKVLAPSLTVFSRSKSVFNADPMAENTDFERENTVKLGANTFASHPFGIGSAADVRRKLAQQTLLRYEGEITAALRLDDSPAAREALKKGDIL